MNNTMKNNLKYKGQFQLLASPQILSEYHRISEELAKDRPFVDIASMLDLIAIQAKVLDVADLPEPVCVDPDDDKFLAYALAGNYNLIISSLLQWQFLPGLNRKVRKPVYLFFCLSPLYLAVISFSHARFLLFATLYLTTALCQRKPPFDHGGICLFCYRCRV